MEYAKPKTLTLHLASISAALHEIEASGYHDHACNAYLWRETGQFLHAMGEELAKLLANMETRSQLTDS